MASGTEPKNILLLDTEGNRPERWDDTSVPLLAPWLYSAHPCALLVKRPPPEAINHTWYHHYYQGHDSYLAILLPNPFYPGPWAVPQTWMVLVGTDTCGQTQEICNGPLKPGAQYR